MSHSFYIKISWKTWKTNNLNVCKEKVEIQNTNTVALQCDLENGKNAHES